MREALIPYCAGHGLRYTAFSPLAGGMLTGKYRFGEEPPAGSRLAHAPEVCAAYLSEESFAAIERLRRSADARRRDHGERRAALRARHAGRGRPDHRAAPGRAFCKLGPRTAMTAGWAPSGGTVVVGGGPALEVPLLLTLSRRFISLAQASRSSLSIWTERCRLQRRRRSRGKLMPSRHHPSAVDAMLDVKLVMNSVDGTASVVCTSITRVGASIVMSSLRRQAGPSISLS